jgi:ribonuclease P protein component
VNEPSLDRPRLSFPLARHRLRSSDFARVYRRGRRAQGKTITVVVLENGLERSRLGLSVSKRQARAAVDRNRLRRRLREAFRTSLPVLQVGLDVVVIAIDPGRGQGFAELRAELLDLVARALRKRPRPDAREDRAR